LLKTIFLRVCHLDFTIFIAYSCFDSISHLVGALQFLEDNLFFSCTFFHLQNYCYLSNCLECCWFSIVVTSYWRYFPFIWFTLLIFSYAATSVWFYCPLELHLSSFLIIVNFFLFDFGCIFACILHIFIYLTKFIER
jgi:hypothetical protein